jgi:hypothetical protein
MRHTLILLATVAFATLAHAQSLSGIKLDPPVAKVGQPVTITGVFDSAGNPNCNLRVEFGDGQQQNFKINQTKDVPLVTTHSYAKAGEYKVLIAPRTAMPMIKCMGADQVAMLKVEAAAAAKAAAPSAKAAPTCPEGWKLSAKSVNRKTGAYTCTAKAGTMPPSAKLECKSPLGYFENPSKGQLGCRR